MKYIDAIFSYPFVAWMQLQIDKSSAWDKMG
jgi:hypothetical protein